MAAIDDLMKLVPPPEHPICGQGDWLAVEKELEIVFPSDYKLYIEHYGQGELCSLFAIESPFGLSSVKEHWRNLFGYYEDWAGDEREIPFPLHPVSPGLFPFGYYGDVNNIAWYTEGDPDTWPIVYCDRAEGFFLLNETPFLSFLLAALKGHAPLPKDVFTDDILHQPFIFRPNLF